MGADFLFGAVELPPADLDLDELCAKAREIVLSDEKVQGSLLDTVNPNATDEDLAGVVVETLMDLLNGEYARCLGEVSTYNKDGEPIVLTISGMMSWGDVDPATESLWIMSCLPERWWKPEVVESPSGWSYVKTQENGDEVDCWECGNPLNDDYVIVNDEDGYAYHYACKEEE